MPAMLPTVLTQAEQPPLPRGPSLDLPETFRRVFRRLGIPSRAPSFNVEYRPFAGLRSTIRVRENRADVRISDVLEGAPPLVLEALAEILIAQVFRRRPSREAKECYLAYVFRPSTRRKIEESRRRRSAKRLLPPRGRWHDLSEIFRRLNRRFFRGELPQPRLGWSSKRSRTVLGHYDSAHGVIIINPVLDSSVVPRYLVEYLVFHEMLHLRYPVERCGHRRVLHSREFRQAEKRFPQYEQARRKLKQFCV
jgi:hypothetical protein